MVRIKEMSQSVHHGRGPLPVGWYFRESIDADLLVVGPHSHDERPATVQVTLRPATHRIEAASMRLMHELQTQRPEALLANCELWPHLEWGEGRFIQTAFIDGDATLAHDVYLFIAGEAQVRIDVECSLGQLLSIEEAVATIVAHLSLREPEGAR